MADFQKKWLVKSGSFIFGPFDDATIENKLRDRSFTVRDEISGPMKNWIEINENLYFDKIVEELRVASFNEEAMEMTNTNVITDLWAKDSPDKNSEESEELKKPPLKKVNEKSVGRTTMSKSSYPPAKPISSSNKLSKLLLFISMPVFAFFIYKYTQSLKANTDNVVEVVKSNFQSGLYSEVIEQLEKDYKAGKLDEEGAYLLVNSYLKENLNERAYDLLKEDQAVPMNIAKKNNLLGLYFIKQKDKVLAEKHFNKSLEIDNRFIPPYINLVISSIGTPDIPKYTDRLASMVQDFSGKNEFFLIFLIGSVESFLLNNNKRYLNRALEALNKVMIDENAFALEFNLLSFYMNYLLNNAKEFDLNNELDMFDFDDYRARETTVDKEIDRNFYSIFSIKKYCKDIISTRNELELLKEYCNLGNNIRGVEGYKTHPVVLAKLAASHYTVKDPYNAKFESSLLIAENKNNELVKKYKLPLIMRIRSCLYKKDSKCLKETSHNLFKVNSKSVLANYAKAQHHYLDRDFKKSYQTLNGFNKYNYNYKPSLKLLEMMKRHVD